MEFIENILDRKMEKRSAVTLGKFDGLHRGHRLLVDQVLQKKQEGYTAALFTFDTPPSWLFDGHVGDKILTNGERRILAEKLRIDVLVQCPFTKKVACMEPEDFVKSVLVEKMNAGFIVVGKDFHFGHNRRGDITLLAELANRYGYEFVVIPKKQYYGRDVSSSYIREMLRIGNMELAQELLGYPYFIAGEVVRGKQLGRTVGIPTANLVPDAEKLLPPNGVYASKVIVDGNSYYGMTNIGVRSTVEDTDRKNVGTYLLDYEGELYGENIMVQLLHYERPECKFTSVEELGEQLFLDVDRTRRLFNI